MLLHINIDIKELIYDIQNKTYLTGRSRSDGKNYRQVALMQANNDDENLNQIMRSIGNAFAKIKVELAEVLTDIVKEGDNTLSTGTESQELVLEMPDNFNTAATDSIISAIHQYIVAFSTAEWFMITNKTDTEDYTRLSSSSLEQLRESLCKRRKPTRAMTNDQLA
ncbi:MAG: hypothetical protein K2K45_06885 [Muribaculaceae bacterium]|nr:hypothetical protein [Muribaculaceae bacterium]MDE7096683.1 hypothetical protein [Muribaculaceae bacterium]